MVCVSWFVAIICVWFAASGYCLFLVCGYHLYLVCYLICVQFASQLHLVWVCL